jgi:hypothetical protein
MAVRTLSTERKGTLKEDAGTLKAEPFQINVPQQVLDDLQQATRNVQLY